MGAGASSQQDLEAMLTCTFLLGQALNRVFPDIYSLSDFDVHPDKVKRDREALKKKQQQGPQFTAMVLTADGVLRPVSFNPDGSGGAAAIADADEEGAATKEEDAPGGVDLEQCFVFQFQDNEMAIPLEDLNKPNEDGWTPLHAACHQHAAVNIAAQIIAKLKSRGEDLNLKTVRGPGSFASKWTPLHIAAAYGIKETVSNLIAAGASVDEKNGVGWSPVFESIHRGYVEVTDLFLKSGACVTQPCPPTYSSPHHAQYPLAHAARMGHKDMVNLLINNAKASQTKDKGNEHGWTALHEACFFNRLEIVQLLLMHGCDTGAKTDKGFLPVDLTMRREIRDAVLDAMPEDEKEKYKARFKSAQRKALGQGDNSSAQQNQNDNPENQGTQDDPDAGNGESKVSESKQSSAIPVSDNNGDEDDDIVGDGPDENAIPPSYRLLGDLPGLPGTSGANKKGKSKGKGSRKKRRGSKSSSHQVVKGVAPPEEGVPAEFACALTGKLMADPVKPPFAEHYYERENIEQWLKTQGNLDPVTGMPLATCELVGDADLRIEISDWQLQQTLKTQNANVPSEDAEEDLYNF